MDTGETALPHDMSGGSDDHPDQADGPWAVQDTGAVPGAVQGTRDLLLRLAQGAVAPQRLGSQAPGQASGTALWALGLLMGAAAMYLLDAEHGEQRRATVTRRMTQYRDEVEETLDRAGEQALGRVRGTLREALRYVRESMIPDETIVRSIHARLEDVLPFEEAAQLHVAVRQGQVVLEGSIAPDRVNRLLGRVATVPGVRGLDNRLVVRSPTT